MFLSKVNWNLLLPLYVRDYQVCSVGIKKNKNLQYLRLELTLVLPSVQVADTTSTAGRLFDSGLHGQIAAIKLLRETNEKKRNTRNEH